MNDRIHELLSPYEHLRLECDGFTRVAHYLLEKAEIPHICMGGQVRIGGELLDLPHFWIATPDGHVVDYKLRMWLGPMAPHGVFYPRKYGVVYEGEPREMYVPEWMFVVLTMPDPPNLPT